MTALRGIGGCLGGLKGRVVTFGLLFVFMFLIGFQFINFL